MTKGQIEFLASIGVIIVGVGLASHIGYKAYTASKNVVVPVVIPTYIPTSTPILTPTPTPTPTSTSKCNILKDIHVTMIKAEVIEMCGEPDKIDQSSIQVKTIEKIFKHDEIWYYAKENAYIELTNDVVTSVRVGNPPKN